MTPDEFCRWLQGFAELHDGQPTEAQWRSIKEHLQTIYAKVTPAVDHAKPSTTVKDDMKRTLVEMRSQFGSSTRIC